MRPRSVTTYPDGVTTGRLEILVEPFAENEPGPHVVAVVRAAEAAGLAVEMGPFATVVTGEVADLVAMLAKATIASLDAGATALQIRLETT